MAQLLHSMLNSEEVSIRKARSTDTQSSSDQVSGATQGSITGPGVGCRAESAASRFLVQQGSSVDTDSTTSPCFAAVPSAGVD